MRAWLQLCLRLPVYLGLCAGMWGGVVHADNAQDPPAADALVVNNPLITVVGGRYVLNARLDFVVPSAIEQHIREGAALQLELRVRFTRHRTLWRDAQLAQVTERLELQYHSVSERYVLRNQSTALQTSYLTLTEALVSMQHIDNVPLLEVDQVPVDERNLVNVQAMLGERSIPGVLSALLFWKDEFVLESPWYTWPLEQPHGDTSREASKDVPKEALKDQGKDGP